jgi:hypothetical protein
LIPRQTVPVILSKHADREALHHRRQRRLRGPRYLAHQSGRVAAPDPRERGLVKVIVEGEVERP